MIESNLMLEQYSRYKKMSLEESPYRCLLNTHIELNPHQINAFCDAVQALKTGGMVLADEVGLGKTIEAGLVIKYVLNSGAKYVLIALPATLRKQWELELDEKFEIEVKILDRLTVRNDYYNIKKWLANKSLTHIIITSYDYASKFMKSFNTIQFDFVVVDEAHNLRNVFHGTKRAKNLFDITKGIPKILLTATPLQNTLSDLHGLVSFIDPRIFGNEKVFNKRFLEGHDYGGLKDALTPVLHRTLRKDVGEYMDFTKRICKTIDFSLSPQEGALYAKVNSFLKREPLYSIPVSNKALITLIIRKLLASSSFALIETFEVFRKRLQKLYEGTKSENAQDGFDLFWSFVEDEMDEDSDNSQDNEELLEKQAIQAEIHEVDAIIQLAKSITHNAKISALKKALTTAFDYQISNGMEEKVVVFTESKRTQKYIASELRKEDYAEDDILLFNGDFDEAMSKEIYRAWNAKNYGKPNYGRSVEFKHAIVDYFQNHAKILLVTDAGSEGLNLQFCNTVINYDLPWNPQKIEQRIGRCHRYGQKHDVVAINLLNTQNEADKRVYDILSRKFELFEGVFGASDVALGVLESGQSFERMILEIYQNCNTPSEFKREFDKLDRRLEGKRDKQAAQLRALLLTESKDSKGTALSNTKRAITQYLDDVKYWEQFQEPEMDGQLYYWKIDNWGMENFGSHGVLFLGAFCNGGKMLFPVLLLCDEKGQYINFTEKEIIGALEKADDQDVRYFTPTKEEGILFNKIYDQLTKEMTERYSNSVKPIKDYNRTKVENWVEIQKEQLNIHIAEMLSEINELRQNEADSSNFYEKVDIRKKIDEKKKSLQEFQNSFHAKIANIQTEGEQEIERFNKTFDISPVLLVNIILRF